MEKRNAFLLFGLLVSILFITSCGSTSTSSGEYSRTGTQGIEINFMNNAPPNEIYVDSGGGNEFEASIELKNKGAYPAEGGSLEGKLYIGGFDQSVISGSWDGGDNIPSGLMGKNPLFPEGGYEIKSYRDSDVNFPFASENYEPTIQVTACYNYETKATPLICIDPSPTSTSIKNKVCTVKDTSLSGGQGGPVGVTKIEQTGNSKKTIFKIYVSNLGNGKIISLKKYSTCLDLKYDEVDRVEVSAEISSLGRGDCTPEGTANSPLRLQDGEGFIVCTFNNPTGEAYTTPLEITLKYGYSSSISKKINIIKMEN
jgi:hypothetical protein